MRIRSAEFVLVQGVVAFFTSSGALSLTYGVLAGGEYQSLLSPVAVLAGDNDETA